MYLVMPKDNVILRYDLVYMKETFAQLLCFVIYRKQWQEEVCPRILFI